MVARNREGRFCILRRCALLLAVLCLLVCQGCATDTHPVSLPRTPGAQSTPAASSGGRTAGPPAPIQTPHALQGPTNFQLALPLSFSLAKGVIIDDQQNTTAIEPKTVESDITAEMKRLLFVVDSSDSVKVYSPGIAPIPVQITFSANKGVDIQFKKQIDSEAGSVTMSFHGVLLAGKLDASYEQQYTPSMLINAQASDVVVSFTTNVKWISADQIPAAPGKGSFHYERNGNIVLSWVAGRNAVAYNVYRQISDHNQQFQLLVTVKGVSYVDNSAEAEQQVHSQKGITYVIFAVGPSGVENPGGIVITVG